MTNLMENSRIDARNKICGKRSVICLSYQPSKWINIKASEPAMAQMAKVQKNIPSGSGRYAVSPQFLHLEWLNVFIEHCETVSNITTVEETAEEVMLIGENAVINGTPVFNSTIITQIDSARNDENGTIDEYNDDSQATASGPHLNSAKELQQKKLHKMI